MGRRTRPHFSTPKPEPFDEWDGKAIAERAGRAAHPQRAVVLVSGGAATEWLWRVHADGEDVGGVRRVHLDAPVWASPAFGIELVLAEMPNAPVASLGQHRYV